MSKRQEFIAALAAEVDDREGWLSDAQNADLDLHSDDTISFLGEGSIDLSHIASIAESVWGKSG